MMWMTDNGQNGRKRDKFSGKYDAGSKREMQKKEKSTRYL
jgi:hypothetical protein